MSREFLEKHIADIIAFYEPRVVDPQGGYRQSFYIDGTEFNPGFQQIVSSARFVINFMSAGKVLGRPELLEIGRHGVDYLEQCHFVREKEMYAFTIRNYSPEDMTQQAYGYAFVLAAHAAARFAGVGSDDAVAKVFDLLERRFWLPDKCAYADTLSESGILDKYRGQNSNMHICEGLIAAYEATKDERYLQRAEVLTETFTQKLAAKADGLIWEHFTCDYDVDWEYNKDDPKNLYRPWGFQPGHQIEWTKNLLHIYRHVRKDWMLKRARELFDKSYEASWDSEHGGMVYGFGPDMKWCDDDKYFWVQAESIASAALLYEATGEQKYRDCYNALWEYCWRHFVDHSAGGWLTFKLTRDGKRYNDEKVIPGAKVDYHSLVACVTVLRSLPVPTVA